MIELNLLPDLKKEFIKAQRMRNTVVSGSILTILIALGLLALLATIVYGAQAVIIDNLKKEVTENHKKLAAKPEINKYLTVQNQLELIGSAASERTAYDRIFDYITKLNPAPPNDITIYSLVVDAETSSITLEGSTANFETVNNFKNTLENAKLAYSLNGEKHEGNFFTAVTVAPPTLSAADGRQTAYFNISVAFDPKAFDPDAKDINVTIPKLVTSDADRHSPRELFGASPIKEINDGN